MRQISGLILAYTRRFKWLTVFSFALRLVGCGIMIRARGALGSDVEVSLLQPRLMAKPRAGLEG